MPRPITALTEYCLGRYALERPSEPEGGWSKHRRVCSARPRRAEVAVRSLQHDHKPETNRVTRTRVLVFHTQPLCLIAVPCQSSFHRQSPGEQRATPRVDLLELGPRLLDDSTLEMRRQPRSAAAHRRGSASP